jgi:plastocyanin
MTLSRVVVIGTCLVALAACGSTAATGPATQPTDSMPGMSMTPSSAAAAAPVATDQVAIKDFAFAPGAVTVKVGTTVTWTNNDQDPHTVTSTGTGGPLKSATMQNGDKYTFTFTTAGTFEYLCTIHPFMTATVTVTP